jgi:hypothetical protein
MRAGDQALRDKDPHDRGSAQDMVHRDAVVKLFEPTG